MKSPRVNDLEGGIGMYKKLFWLKIDLKYCFKYIYIKWRPALHGGAVNGEEDLQPVVFRHCSCLNIPLMLRWGALGHCCEISAVQRESQLRPVPWEGDAQVTFQIYRGSSGSFLHPAEARRWAGNSMLGMSSLGRGESLATLKIGNQN